MEATLFRGSAYGTIQIPPRFRGRRPAGESLIPFISGIVPPLETGRLFLVAEMRIELTFETSDRSWQEPAAYPAEDQVNGSSRCRANASKSADGSFIECDSCERHRSQHPLPAKCAQWKAFAESAPIPTFPARGGRGRRSRRYTHGHAVSSSIPVFPLSTFFPREWGKEQKVVAARIHPLPRLRGRAGVGASGQCRLAGASHLRNTGTCP